MNPNLADRIRGVLWGQAVGDALGYGAEMLSKSDVERTYPGGLRSYRQITRFPGNPSWQPGDWTDDTDQMMCILESLLARQRLDVHDIAARLQHWALADGYGMGSTSYAVARHPQFVREPQRIANDYWTSTGRQAASNGGVMRTSVLGVWNAPDPAQVREDAEQCCLLTHPDPRCIGSCVAICLAIRELVHGIADIETMMGEVSAAVQVYHPEIGEWLGKTADASLEPLDLDDSRNPGEGNRLGYTLKTLAAAFWALRHASTFAEGILAVIHEGGDADTNAAVAGALLGARFGARAINADWIDGLLHRERLRQRADELVAICIARWGTIQCDQLALRGAM
jgi:ADP-ribosylglycohydrolase